MNTNEFAQTLLTWIKTLLLWIGIPHPILNKLDEIIFLVFIIIIAFAIGTAMHYITLYFTRRILKYKQIGILSSLIEYNALRKISAIIPPLIIASLLPFAFDYHSTWFIVSEKITWIYFFIALLFSVNAILNSVGDVLMSKEQLQNKPMKGFIQIFQVIFSCIAIIIIISILINKSPLNLIFKDTILGFVAGVLLSENDMIRIGDWIEMPQNNVNGIVTDITLNIVKIQNFDNTTVTIPPYSLVSGSFINWRGMTESGGRRIMREYTLKLDYIKPCTSEFLEKMKGFDIELSQFITIKQKQATEDKIANTENPDGLVNGTIDTNVGLLRAYMTMYLRRHPFISKDLLFMVRTLAPTENGLPMQIYCFSINKNWPSYESIQAEIMEHFVSVLPEFELYPFQNPSARDYIISSLIEAEKDLSTINAIPWHSVQSKEK